MTSKLVIDTCSPCFKINSDHFKGRYVPISTKKYTFQNIFDIFVILVFLTYVRYKKN